MGYFYVIIASVLFGLSPTLSALLQKSGWSNGAVLLNSEIFGVLCLLLLIRGKRFPLRISGREFTAAAGIGGITFWGTNILLQTSYQYLPNPGIATVLHFIYPVAVMSIMVLLFKEQITLLKLACIGFSLCGIILVADISETSRQTAVLLPGVLSALASGVTYAVYIIVNDKSAAKKIDPLVLIFYVLLGGVMFNSIYLWITHDFAIDLSGRDLLYASALPLCSFSALLTIAEGIRRIGATKAAMINMLEPVVSMIVSAVVFPDKSLTVHMLCGGALILLGTGTIALLNDSGGRQKEISKDSKKEER